MGVGVGLWLSLMTMSYAYSVEVKELAVEWKAYDGGRRDPQLIGEEPNQEYNLIMNVDVFGPVYWHNRIESTTTNDQFRQVAWRLEFGVRTFSWLDLYFQHYSSHLLDKEHPFQRFPAYNAWGVRIYLYKRDKNSTLIPFW